MPSRSFLLNTYRAATTVFSPFAGLLLRARFHRGKEDATRLKERTGVTQLARPDAPAIWLHGASVGEAIALLPLIDRLSGRGLHLLVTTGTRTSAEVMAQRLPPGATHQYVPLDVPKFLRRFLSHWQPNLFILAESELWPNMLIEIFEARIPAIIVNGRMSERSMQRWLKAPVAAENLVGRLALCLTQSEEDARRFTELGATHARSAGNLKFDSLPPPVDNAELARLTALVGTNPVWLAASTHPGEEEIALAVHNHLLPRWPNLLTIILPRHPGRGAEISALAASAGLAAHMRSRRDALPSEGGIYIADTIGETGLFYRLSGIAFMGRSLAGGGGQNPIEPAKLGTAILHGPQISNFMQVYSALHETGGAIEIDEPATLPVVLDELFSNAGKTRELSRAAFQTVERIGGATDRIMQALEPYLSRL